MEIKPHHGDPETRKRIENMLGRYVNDPIGIANIMLMIDMYGTGCFLDGVENERKRNQAMQKGLI